MTFPDNLSVDDLMADIAVIFHWPPSELNSLNVTELITWREKALQRSGNHHEQ
ncbi:GpE family phage tail protein [Enterobacter roggenkampii]|uniref:GpE family phage tail protein n=1 Tax=Enterobacter roggenkampii TaxID=1812935 RepID=UPI002AC31E74|nr:GpE family phage tail protein [Enterobacter roggenkampii]